MRTTKLAGLAAALACGALAAAPAGTAAKPPEKACTTEPATYDDAGPPLAAGPVDDPLYPRQWGLTQIKAPAAWQRGATGAGAVVAVLDTGVDLGHPDLAGQLVAGVDLVAGEKDCPAGPQDEHGHGTHVAGIAAAATDNGTGVAGTAPDARIMPVRVLDEEGSGSMDDVVEGIRWATDHGADVINLSLGELPVIGQLEALNEDVEEAVAYADANGVLVVAAAGNETFPLCSYPAAARRAICVGATDRRGLPSFYSNFPNDPDAVGVRAPGGAGTGGCEDDEDVWSTIWPGSGLDCAGAGLLGGAGLAGYDTLAGTSMATPFVAGVAALLAAQGLDDDAIRERIRTTSSNRGAYDPVYGYGIVDADAATAG